MGVAKSTNVSASKPAVKAPADAAPVDAAVLEEDVYPQPPAEQEAAAAGQIVTTAFASAPESGVAESLTFAIDDGQLVVTCSAPELRFGREEAAGLQRHFNRVAGLL